MAVLFTLVGACRKGPRFPFVATPLPCRWLTAGRQAWTGLGRSTPSTPQRAPSAAFLHTPCQRHFWNSACRSASKYPPPMAALCGMATPQRRPPKRRTFFRSSPPAFFGTQCWSKHMILVRTLCPNNPVRSRSEDRVERGTSTSIEHFLDCHGGKNSITFLFCFVFFLKKLHSGRLPRFGGTLHA